MVPLSLDLLGTFDARINNTRIDDFPTDKIRALLAYLAVESTQAHSRPHLATLFWGDLDDAAARSNLRKSLFRLRKSLGDIADNVLTISRASIEFHAVEAQVDVLDFSTLTQSNSIEELARAAACYKGTLLEGFELAGAPDFDEWLYTKREQLHQQFLTLLNQLGELYLAQNEPDYQAAQSTAMRQLALEPWREVAHRQLMRIFMATGQRSEALAQYDRCVTVLEEELGISPSADTEQLATAIRGDQLITTHLHHFETAHTPFIGREQDINHIIARLNTPGSRLLTLTGPGGIGKSRLAMEVVKRSVANREAYFVPLEGIVATDQVWQVIGERLNIPPSPRGILVDDIFAFLNEREPLLLLDNFEQLLPDTTCVEQLLSRAPEVRLLVTSRAPLKLRAEWRLVLDGLPIPPEEHTQEIDSYGAIQLLVATGQQVDPSFDITPQYRRDLIKICRILDGMPLALEMAGSWFALFTPDLLAKEIENNLDLLVATRQDIPERHQSLRAIFDHAQAQLNLDERQLLRYLSLFKGSFDIKAVMGIIPNTLPLSLNGLIEHALIQRRGTNRFGLHPVLNSFLREGEPPASQLILDHAAYYLDLVAKFRIEHGNGEMIRPDMKNIREGWHAAFDQNRLDLIFKALDGLRDAFHFTGAFSQAVRIFGEGADKLPPSELKQRHMLAKALFLRKLGDVPEAIELVQSVINEGEGNVRLEALIQQAKLYEQTSQFDEALKTLERARDLADPISIEMCDLLNIFGTIYGRRNEGSKSLEAHHQGIEIAETLQAERRLAEHLANSAVTLRDLTEYDQAIANLDKALNIAKRLNHQEEIGRYTHYRASIHWQRDELDLAKACWEEALAIATAINHKRNRLLATGNLGVIYSRENDFERAILYYQNAQKIAREIGERALEAVYVGNAGNVYRYQASYPEAIEQYELAAAINLELDSSGARSINLGNIGEVYKLQGKVEEALPYFEEAIATFRQSQMRYYLCWVLTAYAQSLLELDRTAEAKLANDEGNQIANEIDRESYILVSRITDARIQAAQHNTAEAIVELKSMGADFEFPEAEMEIEMALWELTGDQTHRENAMNLLENLYESTRFIHFKHLLNKLRATV